MELSKLSDFKEDFALLIEAGFIAVKQFDEVSATRIFRAAQVLNPESTAPQIGLGYIAFNKLEIKEATRIFDEVVNKEPDNYLAQIFLGMSYLLDPSKRQVGEELIRTTLTKSQEPTLQHLGTLALEWSEKELKKAKSPFSKTEEPTSKAEAESEEEATGEDIPAEAQGKEKAGKEKAKKK